MNIICNSIQAQFKANIAHSLYIAKCMARKVPGRPRGPRPVARGPWPVAEHKYKPRCAPATDSLD